MGARRKTYTNILDGSKMNGRGGNFRGLNKPDLAGVIFGCNHSTYNECVTQLIFGLPKPHIAYVKNIGPGMPLFLFNYSDKKMHGIFQAVSCGQMNINPYGWTANVAEKTHFPAQVRVCIRKKYEPLSEPAFKNIISVNYYTKSLFWFELDQSQVDALMTLYESRSNKSSSDIDVPKSSQNRTAPSSSNVWQTVSAGKSLDFAEMGSDGNSSGDWTMMPPNDKDMPYRGGGDPWEENSETSDKNEENCEITVSDDEKSASGEIIRSPAVSFNYQPESVEIGSVSNGAIKSSSNENLELVLEKLKRLEIICQNSLPNPILCESAKDDNNNIIIPEQFQKHIEQMQQEIGDLRAYVEKTDHEFQSATEIKEHRNKNLLLEQKQGPGPIRDGPYARGPRLPPHPAGVEKELELQHKEIQRLVEENRLLAALHSELRKDHSAAMDDIHRLNQVVANLQADKEHQVRELIDKCMKLEAELQEHESLRSGFMQLCAEAQKLSVSRQDLMVQVQALTQDLNRAESELQQMPALKMERDTMQQELIRSRAANSEQEEQKQVMENKLIRMAREVEKFRVELTNSKNRAWAAGTPGGPYGSILGKAPVGYTGPYAETYGMHLAQPGAEKYPQYGGGPDPQGQYEEQRSHGRK